MPATRGSAGLGHAAALSLGVTSTAAAQTPSAPTQVWFLQLETVKDESLDQAHKDWIEILSFQWGVGRPATAATGAAGAASAPAESDPLVVTKCVDLATPKLMDLVAKGTHLNTVILSLCEKTGLAAPVEYLRFTMSDVLVLSIDTGGQRDSTRPVDTVVLKFTKVGVAYTKQGTALSTQFNWDFKRNAAY